MNTSLINDFDTSGLDSTLTVVRCKTQEEANLFLEYRYVRGDFRQGSRDALRLCWGEYRRSTCYRLYGIGYCSDSYYLREGWTVVDFCDIYHPQKNDPMDITLGFDELFS